MIKGSGQSFSNTTISDLRYVILDSIGHSFTTDFIVTAFVLNVVWWLKIVFAFFFVVQFVHF